MDYREIIESRYNRKNWQELLFDIFRNKAQFWQQPQRVPVDESMAKSAYYTGKISLPDGHTIAIYEVELSDNVVIERNRAGIRNLLCTNWRGMGCSGAFMFCFRQQEAVLRFSYVSEAFTFAEDGSLKKDSTDTKRFTYLLGEGHRSRTAIQQFEKLKASGLTLKDITKAFSVEALSDLFFKEYKKQYEDIIEFVTGKRMVKVANKWEERVTGEPCAEIMQEFAQFPDAEKAVRDYVKKLMGRLVFIQFLQKKGWMGCSAGEAWNDGDREFVQNLFANTTHKNTFIDEVLEPLFNDINTKRKDDLASDWSNFYLLPYGGRSGGGLIKVPYLNGGLFEHDDYDKTAFPLPAKYMKSLLDFFASYNFTIDENDPDDAEIGVDPEMLGRIFENLLEDNKDKGAFYTPKEIVQYMCRESLIAYLQTDEENEAVKLQIREFVTTNNSDLLSADLATSIDQKLKDVKICDPAIGSGAFPMGLMKELYACRIALSPLGESEGASVQIKTHIIQNNIYGVDIEKGAVDIARLRFWLALIVDEKTPHALPNMDFKIMQGNSLLEQYEGVELSGMSLNEQEKKRSRKKKEQAWQQTFAFDEEASLDNIQNAIREYYGTDDHRQKTELRNIINSNVKSYILNLKGCTPDIQRKLENLPIPNDQFFLWHIYFKEVFDKGGFDIVIGNPPYIQLQNNEGLLAELYQGANFDTFTRMGDIFCLFYEKGIKILKERGLLCFITSNKWMKAGYGEKLRQFFVTNCNPMLLIDFNGLKIFDNASVDTNILLVANSPEKSSTTCCTFSKDDRIENVLYCIDEYIEKNYVQNVFLNKDSWGILTKQENAIKNKIWEIGTILKDWNVQMNYGLKTGFNDAFLITTDQRTELLSRCLSNDERSNTASIIRPFLRGRDIKRYKYTWSGLWMIWVPWHFPLHYDNEIEGASSKAEKIFAQEYPALYAHLSKFRNELSNRNRAETGKRYEWYALQRWGAKYWQQFAKPKIVYPDIAQGMTFALAEDGEYLNNTAYFMTIEDDTPIKYLINILNSKLLEWYYRTLSVQLGTAAIRMFSIYMENLPVVKFSGSELQNRITTAEEREIDRLVYDLYGLTEDEIAIVEGTN